MIVIDLNLLLYAYNVTGAVLAALAMEHGASLASSDRDFRRFPDLRWLNPLSP